MKSKDWFIVGVRLIGVWVLFDFFGYVIDGCQVHFRMFKPLATTEMAYWFHAVVLLIIGVAMILCAPLFAKVLDWESLPEKPCAHCGYDLRASKDRCPECGTAIPETVER